MGGVCRNSPAPQGWTVVSSHSEVPWCRRQLAGLALRPVLPGCSSVCLQRPPAHPASPAAHSPVGEEPGNIWESYRPRGREQIFKGKTSLEHVGETAPWKLVTEGTSSALTAGRAVPRGLQGTASSVQTAPARRLACSPRELKCWAGSGGVSKKEGSQRSPISCWKDATPPGNCSSPKLRSRSACLQKTPGAGGTHKIQMVGDHGCRRQALFGHDLNKVSKNGTVRKIGLPTRCLLLLKLLV